MAISVFDLFKVGIGPSSSHTGGPMVAAHRFAHGLSRDGLVEKTAVVRVILYGSLGLTGKGHGSDKAVALGLEGDRPELVDVDTVDERLAAIRSRGSLRLFGTREIPFVVGEHLSFERPPLRLPRPRHQDHEGHRPRHARQIQGDRTWRTCR